MYIYVYIYRSLSLSAFFSLSLDSFPDSVENKRGNLKICDLKSLFSPLVGENKIYQHTAI